MRTDVRLPKANRSVIGSVPFWLAWGGRSEWSQDVTKMIKKTLGMLFAAAVATGCTPEAAKSGLTNDCSEEKNNSEAEATEVPAEDGFSESGLDLCEFDYDYYSVTVEPGTLAYVEITFDGEESDLMLDLYDDNGKEMDAADSGLSYERVGIHTPASHPSAMTYTLRVRGYHNSTGEYGIAVRTFPYEDGLVCQDDCYRIMQFPAPHADEQYLFDSASEYRNARRELIMLVRYAVDQTYKRYPGTKYLGLIDMSERDGSTPGTAYGDLRHPEGTHIQGNDMDLAYFQTSPDNHARPVCANDGYFCTTDVNSMDAEMTAYFFAKLYESPRIRVIGVDTKLADDLIVAADALLAEGAITESERIKFEDRMAYGEGWPFHHHHFHLSLKWIDESLVYESKALVPDGWDLDPYADLE